MKNKNNHNHTSGRAFDASVMQTDPWAMTVSYENEGDTGPDKKGLGRDVRTQKEPGRDERAKAEGDEEEVEKNLRVEIIGKGL